MGDKPIGETLARRYSIIAAVGQGGMGTVYRALDTRLQRPVALKILPPPPDAEFMQRFLREAHALTRLSHPNISQVYDSGESGGLLYLAMEYISSMANRFEILG